MPSLDGYSLNEKMDKKFEEIAEQIEVLKFRIETEMKDIKEKFVELSVASSKKKGKTVEKKEKYKN